MVQLAYYAMQTNLKGILLGMALRECPQLI